MWEPSRGLCSIALRQFGINFKNGTDLQALAKSQRLGQPLSKIFAIFVHVFDATKSTMSATCTPTSFASHALRNISGSFINLRYFVNSKRTCLRKPVSEIYERRSLSALTTNGLKR